MVLLGLSAGQHSGPLAMHAVCALGGFVVGALATSRVVAEDSRNSRGDHGGKPSGRIVAAMAAEAALLVAFTVGWELEAARPSGAAQLGLLAVAAIAMGSQSATVLALKLPGISTTYFTGMLTGILGDLATAGKPGIGYRVVLLLALIGGAIATGFAFADAPRLTPVVILVPMACATALAIAAGKG
jgi:uncharacterized membrane protein YoaK (UPF0700 family)